MRRAKMTMLALSLSACARPPAGAAEPPASPVFGAGTCEEAAAAGFVGQPVSAANVEAARLGARAGIVRTLSPGQAVTMEYRGDRLNLDVDRTGVIRAARCG